MSQTPTSSASLLHQLFEAQVDQHPGRTAIEIGLTRLTYRDLDDTSNQLAHYLREFGVGPETCVAFWLPRSMDVYSVLLGILKSGGAYVPLDAEYPAERVHYILADCKIQIVITTAAFANQLVTFSGTVVLIDEHWLAISTRPAVRLSEVSIQTRPNNLCYVIYTSGSTGKPKGVQIEHRSVVHLVRTEATRFAVRSEDRVYQGFSVAFDASVEELWLAWNAGATLVAATPHMVRAGPDLPRLLTAAGVTILSCVPTLLSMMEGDLPNVRIIIVGGEACSPDLVRRWHRPGRRMFNTYGPTEATVIATWTECDPARDVTIGEPLPGYNAFVMNSDGRRVLCGEIGELYLGGAGLARGYVGREDLTQERFVSITIAESDENQIRLYRTGDMARWTTDGQLEFVGRADGQVKLRGFRVELSEIESEMLRCPGVLAAAAALREDIPGVQQLVGYIVPRNGFASDHEQLRANLRSKLPAYMIPTVFETVESFPTLTSGKVDRKNLPAPRSRMPAEVDESKKMWSPTDDIEIQLAAVWNHLFFPVVVGPTADFFMDLGGHSLLAARMISQLRKYPEFEDVSMLDIYNHPTIETLATALRLRHLKSTTPLTNAAVDPPEVRDIYRVSSWQYFVGGTIQAIGLYFVIGLFSLHWLAPYLTFAYAIDDEYSNTEAVVFSVATLLLLYPAMIALSIAVKWLVLGRAQPGRYPMWGSYFLRWWFVESIRGIVPTNYLTGTPLLSLYYRMMGARIGANVHLGNDGGAMFDLLSIGDDSCLGADSHFTGFTINDGWLILGHVEIGRRCFVGTRSLLGPSTRMDDDSSLEDLSMLPIGGRIPTGERWHGSPSRSAECQTDIPLAPPIPRPSLPRRLAFGLLCTLGLFTFPLLPMVAFFPGMVVMTHLNKLDDYYYYLVLAPLVAVSFVLFISLEIAALKWLLLGRIKPGAYPLHDSFCFRKWFFDRTMTLSLDVIGPLYSTLYLAPWYRLLGANLGRRAEISTASFVSPDCLNIGDESFVADAVSLGAARIRNGFLTIDQITIGTRTFIGNSALIPIGATIPDNCLIGCLSMPPSAAISDGSSWLGSPPFFLPQRQLTTGFPPELTFRPTRRLIALRLFIEFFRVTLPSTCFIVLTNVLLSVFLLIREEVHVWQMILLFPLIYATAGLAAALLLIAFKWLMMGRYHPCERPLWSPFVWRTEVLTALLDNFASPFFLDLMAGTPFICWFFRLLGAKIGRRVYLDTTELTEFDLIKIGDDVAINLDCTLQTHLFEDRVMKMSTIDIGAGCSLGSMSVVLYDTEMDRGSSIGELSLVMKGESLPANTHWSGIPSQNLDTTK